MKGDGIFGFNTKNKINRIQIYFSFNKITKEKINYIEKRTNLNLSLIKKNINKIIKQNLNNNYITLKNI